MVENNKRIKMKAANKKIKRKLKQKQQQKQIVTQNVKVVVGSRPRAKSSAPRNAPAKQPNIISISMPQYQQPAYNPPAANYYERNMNQARERQQEEYTQLIKNPFQENIKIHQAEVEQNENAQVKAGILPKLAAEPNDTSKLTQMLAKKIEQQQNPTETTNKTHTKIATSPAPRTTTSQTSGPPRMSLQEELKAKGRSGLKPVSERQLKTQPPPASPYDQILKKAMSGRRAAIEGDDWDLGTEERKNEEQVKSEIVKVENRAKEIAEIAIKDALEENKYIAESAKTKAIRKKINDEEAEYAKTLQEKQAGAGAGAETPPAQWKGESKAGQKTKPDLGGGAGINKDELIQKLKNMDLTEYKKELSSTSDKIYTVASALGITYTIGRKRMSVEKLRPMIEAMVGRQAPVIHRGRESKLQGQLVF